MDFAVPANRHIRPAGTKEVLVKQERAAFADMDLLTFGFLYSLFCISCHVARSTSVLWRPSNSFRPPFVVNTYPAYMGLRRILPILFSVNNPLSWTFPFRDALGAFSRTCRTYAARSPRYSTCQRKHGKYFPDHRGGFFVNFHCFGFVTALVADRRIPAAFVSGIEGFRYIVPDAFRCLVAFHDRMYDQQVLHELSGGRSV